MDFYTYMPPCNQYLDQDLQVFQHFRKLHCSSSNRPHLPSGNHYSDFYHHRLTLPFKFHINEIMQSLPFYLVSFLPYYVCEIPPHVIAFSTSLCLSPDDYIPLCEYTTTHLSSPPVTDIWVFPVFSYDKRSYYKHSCTGLFAGCYSWLYFLGCRIIE